jgi:hypothetical protein
MKTNRSTREVREVREEPGVLVVEPAMVAPSTRIGTN